MSITLPPQLVLIVCSLLTSSALSHLPVNIVCLGATRVTDLSSRAKRKREIHNWLNQKNLGNYSEITTNNKCFYFHASEEKKQTIQQISKSPNIDISVLNQISIRLYLNCTTERPRMCGYQTSTVMENEISNDLLSFPSLCEAL